MNSYKAWKISALCFGLAFICSLTNLIIKVNKKPVTGITQGVEVMSCQTCSSDKIARVGGKTSDMCTVDGPGALHGEPDYVPRDIGIGGGDYIEFNYCLNCGQIQDTWPKAAPGDKK